MIDIKKAKQVLNEYIKKYDDTNPKIRLKKEHILRVADNAKKLAEKLKLSQEDIDLAELIGLLHDIGRFEQIKRFNTFKDRQSIDHAVQGLQVLFDEGLIRKFLKEDVYDKIIYIAIKNHNKIEIEKGLEERELLHCKIIRDSDKLDIFNVIITEPIENAVWFPINDLKKEKITDKVYENIMKDNIARYEDLKTNADNMVAWYAYVYNINFDETLEEIRKREYIEKMSKKIDYENEETKQRMKNIKEKINKYIDERLKK